MIKDITYNYLIEDSFENFPSDFDINNRKDPDKMGESLYESLKDLYFKNSQFKVENKRKRDFYTKTSSYYTLYINDGEFLLSSDYIGPSIYWASEAGIEDEKIINYLKIARTIGGHMLWPRGKKPTVNQAKAGRKGFHDRIDWTLLAIDIFYKTVIKNKNDETHFILKCNKLLPFQISNTNEYDDKFRGIYKALKTHESWFETFTTFNEFCDFFKLKGSFVDKEYTVTELAPLYPMLPKNYEKYSDNNIDIISKRNLNLFNEVVIQY